jgi:uncharacterized protein YjiS (DUF1127 family)
VASSERWTRPGACHGKDSLLRYSRRPNNAQAFGKELADVKAAEMQSCQSVPQTLVGRVQGGMNWLIDGFQRTSSRHLAKRRRLHELHELSAMNSIELKDIGISRLEISAAMRSNAKFLSRSKD